MIDKTLTLPQIRQAGMKALVDRLGLAGMIRFLQQFDPGSGDYTRERHEWLGELTVDEIARDIGQKQQ